MTQQLLTTSQTYVVPAGVTSIKAFVVGGGGGGGASGESQGGGGGGGGGFTNEQTITVTPGQNITVTIGAGGAKGVYPSTVALAGGSSAFSTITANGGQPGLMAQSNNSGAGGNGGSGGGGAQFSAATVASGAGGTNGSAGNGFATPGSAAGTGQGTTQTSTINGTRYGGGGGGGSNSQAGSTGGAGGLGGGGAGGNTGASASDGAVNTGGGGGGSSYDGAHVNTPGNGGSGVVVIEYFANLAPNAPILNAHANLEASAAQTFSWTFSDPDAGNTQSAYQLQIIRVSDSAVIVDSGKVASASAAFGVAAGTLKHSTAYQWRVATWDNSNAAGPYSGYSNFSTFAPAMFFGAEF